MKDDATAPKAPEFGVPDDDNPEITPERMAQMRRWQPGDPTSSPEAKVWRALRNLVAAERSGEREKVQEAMTAAEDVLAGK